MTTFVAGGSTDFGSTEELREIYNKMDKPNYVLLNNNKPATHFIHIWNCGSNRIKADENHFFTINMFDSMISYTNNAMPDCYTVAVFKIRSK